MWMGIECPCPPVRNDIVSPRHLFSFWLKLRLEINEKEKIPFVVLGVFASGYLSRYYTRTVLFKLFQVNSYITVGFSAVLYGIGAQLYVTGKSKIIPQALFE